MNKLGFLLVTLTIWGGGIWLPSSPASAQNSPQRVRTDLSSALRVVNSLIRSDPPRAISMLKRLREEYPNHTRIHLLLGETYQTIGEVDSSRAAYEYGLRVDPRNAEAATGLGILFLQNDAPDKADAVFEDILQVTEHGVGTYRTIGSRLSRYGFYEIALKMYAKGRRKHSSNYILILDIAYLHGLMGNHEDALTEYLALIEATPKQHRMAQNRIMELIRQNPDKKKSFLTLLEADVERTAPYREYVMAILAIAYLEGRQPEKALDMTLRADRPTSDGSVLFQMIERVFAEYEGKRGVDNAPEFDLASRALSAYLERHPKASQTPRAKLMLVDLYLDHGRGAVRPPMPINRDDMILASRQALDWIILTYPGTDVAEDAVLRKGHVIFHLEGKKIEALDVYEKGLAAARFRRSDFARTLGEAYLVAGEYDRAERHLQTLIDSSDQALRETGLYYAGRMLSFKHEYEAARDTLTALAEGNPASAFTNDALELAWIIEEGLKGDQTSLHDFIEALKADAAGDSTTVVKELKQIVARDGDSLRPRSMLMLGVWYRGLRQYDAAMNVFEQFTTDYPDDIRMPEVKRRIGEVYERGFGQFDMALKTYEGILLTHPHYIFLDEVRDDVNRIRNQLGATP